MKTFREWLATQEASYLGMPSTRYGMGDREQDPNLFRRVAKDMPSLGARAITGFTDGINSLMKQSGSSAYGYGYSGDSTIGYKLDHTISSTDPTIVDKNGNIQLVLVQYRALESQVYQSQQYNTIREFDWPKTMIGPALQQTRSNKITTFKVSIISPHVDAAPTNKLVDFIYPKDLIENVRAFRSDAKPIEQLINSPIRPVRGDAQAPPDKQTQKPAPQSAGGTGQTGV